MAISNATPIQLWTADEQTYNEKEVCGINPACFCQPVQCDDTIRLYISDDNPEIMFISFLDTDGNYLYNAGFGSSGYHFLTPEDQDICDGQYQVIIYDSTDPGVQKIDAANWYNVSNVWTFGSDYAEIEQTSGTFGQNITLPLGETINFDLSFIISNGGGGPWSGNLVVSVTLNDSLGNPMDEDLLNPLTSGGINGTFNRSFSLTAPSDWPNPVGSFRVGYSTIGTAQAPHVKVVGDTTVIFIPDDSRVYRSDCLDIRTEQPCTELITYSNYNNAFGIDYQTSSPAPVFYLRVPIVFFHESFPMEQEVHKLSNDTRVRLWNEMSRKRKLQLGYMPYYMHQKVNLVLMHDDIQIDGLYWDKDDAYEIVEGDKRSPLKMASVLLTDRDFLKRNLI